MLIGIADYQHFGPNGPPGQSDLAGPTRDVARFRISLRRYGFDQPDDVRILLDDQASREGIRGGFRWLRGRATNPDDVVVIYYSGHGSYARDDDGDERRVTPGDSLDEALVPWDARAVHQPDQLVIDDEIGAWLGALGTRNVTVVFDACYSGTATRGEEVSRLARPKGPIGNTFAMAEGGGRQLLDEPGHVLITAAKATETAMELPLGDGNEVFGALTYFLTRALDAAGPAARYDEVMRQVGLDVRSARTSQTPQLEGDRGALVFRVSRPIARSPFALVAPAGTARFLLDVGAIHGVRRGAVYDVYPPGETRFAAGRLGQLRIDSVAERTAVGVAVGALAGIPPRARATVARLPRGARPVEVLATYLDPTAAAARSSIDSLPFVRLTDAADAVARVSKQGGWFEVTALGLPLPPLPEGSERGSAALGYAGTRASLCGPLSRAYAIAALHGLDNPNAPLSLGVFLQVVPSGAAPTDRRDGLDTVRIGSDYDVYARVEAPEASVLYLSVAAAGYTGDPFVLFPDGRRPNQPFPLNRWVVIARAVSMVEPAGSEILKMVVDSDQFDLNPLIDSFARCHQQRGGEESAHQWGRQPKPVTGWRAAEHQLLILPAARR